MTSLAKPIIGGVYVILGVVFTLLYLPCMKVMMFDRGLSRMPCYMIMVWIGFADFVQLFVGIVGGIWTMLDITPDYRHCARFKLSATVNTRNTNFRLNGHLGALLNTAYIAFVTLTQLLGFNRMVTIVFDTRYETIFSRKLTMVWISLCVIYAGIFHVLFITIARNEYKLDQFIWYYADNVSHTAVVTSVQYHQNNLQLVVNGIWYAIILCYLHLFQKMGQTFQVQQLSTTNNYKRSLMKQAALIFLYSVVLNLLFHLLPAIVPSQFNTYVTVMLQIAWLVLGGINPFIYLTINTTVRRKVIGIFVNVPATQSVPPRMSIRSRLQPPHHLPPVEDRVSTHLPQIPQTRNEINLRNPRITNAAELGDIELNRAVSDQP